MTENFLIGVKGLKPHPYNIFQEKMTLLENIKSQINAKKVTFSFFQNFFKN